MLQGPEPTIDSARKLHRAMSLPEVLLWRALRSRLDGLKFRRQHPASPYVADFFCHKAKLVVEIDGIVHDMGNNPDRDTERDRWFASHDLHVVRIPATDVLRDPDEAAATIVAFAEIPLHHAAHGPPPRAGEDKE